MPVNGLCSLHKRAGQRIFSGPAILMAAPASKHSPPLFAMVEPWRRLQRHFRAVSAVAATLVAIGAHTRLPAIGPPPFRPALSEVP